MQLNARQFEAPVDRAGALNSLFDERDAQGLIDHVLSDGDYGRIALVSSFGADSVVLLHMVSRVNRAAPVLFLETGMLFAETLDYQLSVANRLGLTGIEQVRPDPEDVRQVDPVGRRHITDTDSCCHIRKVLPLERALAPYDGWITGRKRFQGGRRASIGLAEVEGTRLKLNPLAHWTPQEISEYMDLHDLPRHPLVAKGYASIGCAPCTSPVAEGEDPRSGRWRGAEKDECGIHFINGKVVRG